MELINHKNAETYAITQRTSPRFLCCSTALLFFARAALAKNNNAVGRQRNLGLPTHQQQRRPSTLMNSDFLILVLYDFIVQSILSSFLLLCYNLMIMNKL